MAPKTEELKKDPGRYLEEHFIALQEIAQEIGYGRSSYGLNASPGLLGLDSGDSGGDFDVEELGLLWNKLASRGGVGGLGGLGGVRGGSGGGYRSASLRYLAPANALSQAKTTIEAIEKNNAKALIEHSQVTDLQEDLRVNPWSDTGGFGLFAFLQRQLLSSINLTPFNGLNRFEVSDKGLTIFQPFRAVSLRTVSYQDLLDRNVVLSINPPAYFDLMLGLFGQFRWGRNIPSPWGQLVVDEPGSGRIVGTTVVLWPSEKQKEIEKLLRQLYEAGRPIHDRIKDEPSLSSLLMGYSVDEWRDRLTEWRADPPSVPDEYLKILYIAPKEDKKKTKKGESKWPKRFGCIAALLLLLLWPVWRLIAFVWRILARFVPRPLRFFGS